MGVVLPDRPAFVLDLIGVSWPNVDEDDYRGPPHSAKVCLASAGPADLPEGPVLRGT
ncbi:hypothetical protein ACQEVS_14680 [Streptomyces sp. CA-181903]|uniref:hypothetical protein n=1 Tax=Streptomyces sp. CA-181903 TaxID=3240055 RepID=UPI003D949936